MLSGDKRKEKEEHEWKYSNFEEQNDRSKGAGEKGHTKTNT